MSKRKALLLADDFPKVALNGNIKIIITYIYFKCSVYRVIVSREVRACSVSKSAVGMRSVYTIAAVHISSVFTSSFGMHSVYTRAVYISSMLQVQLIKLSVYHYNVYKYNIYKYNVYHYNVYKCRSRGGGANCQGDQQFGPTRG